MMINTSLKRQDKGNRFKLLQVAQRFDLHQIEYGYTKMIMRQKSIYMQSPYFIPDQSYINALKMAPNVMLMTLDDSM